MIAEGIKLLVNARTRWLGLIAILLAVALCGFSAAAGQIDPSKPPPPPPGAQDSTPPIDPSVPPPPPAATAPAPDTKAAGSDAAPAVPAFDPLHAQKSIEVGQYYLKTGNYAAAIDRFHEALGYQANLALPWDLLGQAYEKEHEREEAVAAYKKYLALVPDGKESDRVRKQVAKLESEIAGDAAKQSRK